MRLRWVFTVETAVFRLKNIFELVLDRRYTGRAGRSSRIEGFKGNVSEFLNFFICCPNNPKLISKITLKLVTAFYFLFFRESGKV